MMQQSRISILLIVFISSNSPQKSSGFTVGHVARPESRTGALL
jgi:hypothetical protein